VPNRKSCSSYQNWGARPWPFVAINKGCTIMVCLTIQQHTSGLLKMRFLCVVVTALVVLGGLPFSSDAQLDPYFYKNTCPQVHHVVFKVVEKVSRRDPRMPASLVRLFFHDCFVLVRQLAYSPFYASVIRSFLISCIRCLKYYRWSQNQSFLQQHFYLKWVHLVSRI